MENREIRGKGNVDEIGIGGRVMDYWATREWSEYKDSGILGRYTRQVKQEYFVKIGKMSNFGESSENRKYIENRVYRKSKEQKKNNNYRGKREYWKTI